MAEAAHGAASQLLRGLRQLLALLPQHGLAAELDFVAFERQDLDQNLVAFLQLVAHFAHAVLGDLADVQQAVRTRENLDESAEIHQPHHFAQVGLADLGHGGNVADDLQRVIARGFVGGRYMHGAVVVHVDLHAGLLDDAANHLAAWSDDVADLIGRNVNGVNARRVLRHVGARLLDGLLHLVDDVKAAAPRLLQRFGHDGGGDVRHLDIHLQTRNACARAGDFEIHIAVVVFGARDVGEHGVIVALLHQAHGDTANVRGKRHASVHQGQGCAANGSHGTRSVGFQDVAHHAQRVRKHGFAGDDRQQGPLGQRAVADFAAAGAAHEANLTNAERRKIIVQHEPLGRFTGLQQFDALRIVFSAQGQGHQGLRFAAGEQRGAVGARQHAGFDGDGANLIEGAAIRTAVVLQHLVAEDALFQRLEDLLAFVLLLFGQAFENRLLQFGYPEVALQLGIFFGVQRVGQRLARLGGDLAVEGLVERLGFVNALRLADLCHQLIDGGCDFLATGMAEVDSPDDFLFGSLLRARLHHHDTAFGGGYNDVQFGLAALRIRGVGDIYAVHHTYAHATQHMVERNIGDGQRGAGADHCQGVGILLRIGGEHHGDDLGFMQETFGEQRADRPVDQPAGEDFFFRGPSLAFDEAARNLAGGVSILAIIYRERKEAGIRLRLFGHAGADQHYGISATHDDRAVRLLGHSARFEGDLAASQIDFNCV